MSNCEYEMGNFNFIFYFIFQKNGKYGKHKNENNNEPDRLLIMPSLNLVSKLRKWSIS